MPQSVLCLGGGHWGLVLPPKLFFFLVFLEYFIILKMGSNNTLTGVPFLLKLFSGYGMGNSIRNNKIWPKFGNVYKYD